jgi:serine/threonine protein kinase
MSAIWQSERDPSMRWRVLDKLGEGGQAEVWRVTREQGGGDFVLKVLHLGKVDASDGWKASDRLAREALVLETLDHPGLPRLVDRVRDDAGAEGFVQTFVPGETVAAFTARSGRLDTTSFGRVLRELLDLLRHLHDHSPPVIHRDISPRNVLLDVRPGGRASLIDFGAVRFPNDAEVALVTTAGTFETMAPEQLMGQVVAASDLYALGVTLTSLASGLAPAELPQDPTTGAIDVRKVVRLPEPLVALLEGLTRVGLAERLPTARAALDLLDKDTPEPETSTRPSSISRLARRHLPWALPTVLLFGGWLSTLVPAERERATLGGWFSGHGSLLSKLTATFLNDPHAITSPLVLGPLTWAPSGTHLASATRGELRVWDAADGGQTAVVSFHTKRWGNVLGSGLSADLRHLVLADDVKVELWELAQDEPRQLGSWGMELDHVGAFVGLSLRAPDDIRVVRFEDRALTVTEMTSGRELLRIPLTLESPTLARLTADGDHLVLHSGSEVHRVAMSDGSRLGTTRLEPGAEPPRVLAVDATGETFALAYRDAIEVWRAHERTPSAIIRIDYLHVYFERPDNLALSNDGTLMAFGMDDRVQVYDTRDGTRRFDLGGHSGMVNPVAFSPDGRTLAAAARDGVVRLSDLTP